MKFKNRKGSTLAMTLMVFVVLIIFATFILSFMVTENKQALNNQRKTQAYYIARSGAVAVERAILDMNVVKLDELNVALKSAYNDEVIDDNTIKASIGAFNFDEGSIKNIDLELKDSSLIINSTAEAGGVESEVTVIMEKINGSINIDIKDVAIFAKNSLHFDKTTKIRNGGKLYVGTNATIEGLNTDDYEVVDVQYPSLSDFNINNVDKNIVVYTESVTIINSIDKSTNFLDKSSNITFDGDGTKDNKEFIILTNDKDIDIVVNNLDIKSLVISGNGKVRIFVLNSLAIDNTINWKDADNKTGDSNQLNIYYYGVDEIMFGINNPKLYANLLIKSASLTDESGKNMFFSGLIYAPDSEVNKDWNGTTYGIIAKDVYIKQNTNLNPPLGVILDSIYLNVPDSSEFYSTIYDKGYFKEAN